MRAHEKRAAAYEASGLELTDRQLRALVGAHEGPWTPEGLRATAAELWPAPPEPPQMEISAEERAAHERIAAASTGATPVGIRPHEQLLEPGLNEREFWTLADRAGVVSDWGNE